MRKTLIWPALLALVAAPLLVSAQDLPVPSNTMMLIRLQDGLSTKTSGVGDRFAAEVVSPAGYEGATIRGRIADISRSGRVSGRTEMTLSFDTITHRGRTVPIHADLEGLRQSESVKIVDEEGRIQSGSRGDETIKRTGIGAAVGGVLGGLLGGRKGLLIGILAGGGAGAGSVAIEGARELRLEPGTELEIRTGTESRQLARTDPAIDRGVVRQVQEALNGRGYDSGTPDGLMGRRTRSALEQYQRDNGLAATGRIDRQTADSLGIRW